MLAIGHNQTPGCLPPTQNRHIELEVLQFQACRGQPACAASRELTR
jgi:hypothetical protein